MTQLMEAKKIPPYSEEAERAVLGAILLEAERMMDLCIVQQIAASAFHVPAHRDIYETIRAMHDRGEAIDIVTVCNRLQAQGRLERIGGAAVLDELVINTPTAQHGPFYLGILRQNHLLRSLIEQSTKIAELCYSGEYDGESALATAEAKLFELGMNRRETAAHWSSGIGDVVREVNEIADGKAKPTGVYTGFADLDRKLCGMKPADMVVLAARPSMGKTALALNIAQNVLLGSSPDGTSVPVAMFSLEMPKASLIKRMLCARARVGSHKLNYGAFLSREQHEQLLHAATELQKTPFYIDDTGGLSVAELRSRARRIKRKHDIGLIIIDYLQLLRDPRNRDHGPQWETASISGEIKEMAKELNIPVLILSQLNRASERRENRRPRLSDLRDSGSIEQDADVVCLLHRPKKHPEDPESQEDYLAIVDVAKHRNGDTGPVRLNFIEEYTRFDNRIEKKK